MEKRKIVQQTHNVLRYAILPWVMLIGFISAFIFFHAMDAVLLDEVHERKTEYYWANFFLVCTFSAFAATFLLSIAIIALRLNGAISNSLRGWGAVTWEKTEYWHEVFLKRALKERQEKESAKLVSPQS